MLALLLVVSLGTQPQDVRIENPALERQVRQSLVRYSSPWQVVVADDGTSVLAEHIEVNRFSTISQEHEVGQNLFVDREAGRDFLRTTRQRRGNHGLHASGRNDQMTILRVEGFHKAIFYYKRDHESHVARMDFDNDGPSPTVVSKHRITSPSLSSDNVFFRGFTYENEIYTFEKHNLRTKEVVKRTPLPKGLEPIELDAGGERVLCLRQANTKVERAAVYNLRTKRITLLSQPTQKGHFWFGGNDVYFQGDGSQFVWRDDKWDKISDDLFIGKSANGKYWLVRKRTSLFLQRRS